jgi:heterodisulfide reductase subunit A-like polyferredoxin
MPPTAAADDRQPALGARNDSNLANATPPTTTARVIVIGGGMAGTTLAKYLRLWGKGIEVTLVDRSPALGGLRVRLHWPLIGDAAA